MPALLHRTRMPKPDDPRMLRVAKKCNAAGMQARAIAAQLRIAESTYYEWNRLGLEELRAWEAGEASEPGSHAAFAEATEEGYKAFEARSVVTVEYHKGKQGGWAPALGHLGHVNRRDWGQRHEVSVEQNTTHTLRLELPPGAAEPLLALLRERLPEAKAQGLIEAQSTEVTDGG